MPSRRRKRRIAAVAAPLCGLLVFGAVGGAPVPGLDRAGAAPVTSADTAMSDLTLDHVLVGIADLDAGIRQLAALTGVSPVRGGQHPGRGTQNALLSLGPHTYLELIAPKADAGSDRLAQELARLHELTPVGWAIGTRHAEAATASLRADGLRTGPLQPGSRVRPDGKLLAWRTAEILPAGRLNPFLIEWSPTTTHPAADSPSGCTLLSLTVLGPPTETTGLDRLAAELREPVKVQAATEASLRLSLHCPTGEVTLPQLDRRQSS
jgi:Glyoxalase-like domain